MLMSNFIDILTNKILQTAVIAYLTASMIKIIISFIQNKKFDLSLLLALGGMPSAHSATVSSLAVATGLREGFNSTLFALALIFALVTMRDACGVRAAVGKQANILEYISTHLLKFTIKDLDKVVGHTPLQVLIGGILGVFTALIFV